MKKTNVRDVDMNYTRELEVRPEAQVNEYYIDIANKFKTAKFIIIILLVVFMLFMISVFRSDVTLENCKYLIRFFSSANDERMFYADKLRKRNHHHLQRSGC